MMLLQYLKGGNYMSNLRKMEKNLSSLENLSIKNGERIGLHLLMMITILTSVYQKAKMNGMVVNSGIATKIIVS